MHWCCLFDLAKCFDTINHELLLYKLGKYGLTETELLWFSNYIYDRSQIVNINGQLSPPKLIKTGVSQRSVLGPLLFLLFINDFPSCLSNATCNKFADDNLVYVNGTTIAEVESLLQKSVDESVKWLRMNKLSVNIDKCHVMLISGINTSRYSLNIDIDGVKIPHVRSAKYLGVVIDSQLTCTDHINELSNRLSSRLYILRKLRKMLPFNNFNCIYYAIFQSCIDYCLSVWGSTSEKHLNHLQKLQKRAARIVTQNFSWDESSINIIRNLGWQTIKKLYEFLTCCITHKARNDLAPNYISDRFSSVAEQHSVLTRSSKNNNLYPPKPNLTIFKSSLSYSGISGIRCVCTSEIRQHTIRLNLG